MADSRRLLSYGLVLNVFLALTVFDLLKSNKTTEEKNEPEFEANIEKPLPPPKIMTSRSSGPILKFLFCYS